MSCELSPVSQLLRQVMHLNTVKTSGFSIGIYVRESRDENGENIETIETQKELLLKYVRDNDLGTVYKVYIDDNYSGTNFERPGIKELEKDIVNGGISLLLIKDLSRLGRNNAKTLIFLDFLEEHGVRVITSDGRYDSSNDGDLVGIETWFNERYAKDISRKIRSNLKHKISQGEFLGKPPYGYSKSLSKKNTLQINQEQAQIVKQIYKMYLDGQGYSKIADYLNEKNIPPPSKAKGLFSYTQKWNNVAIKRILSNKVYLGHTVQGVSEKISFKSKKTRRLKSDQYIITENTHEKIIDEETFEAVERFKNSKRGSFSASDKGEIHTYRGIVYCGKCGNVMYARKRKDRELCYICQTYAKSGKSACSSHFVKEANINKVISEELNKILSEDKILDQINNYLIISTLKDSSQNHKGNLVKQLNSLKNKQEKIYMDMLEGVITKDLFIRINNNLEDSIEKINQELKVLPEKAAKAKDSKTLFKELIKLSNGNLLPHEIIKILVKKITIFEKGECLQSHLLGENTQIDYTDGFIFVELNY